MAKVDWAARAKEKFIESQKRDRLVEQSDEIDTFIRFKYDEPLEEKYVKEKLKKYGVL